MKTKTSELTGAALDWAVASCEGLDVEIGPWSGQPLVWMKVNMQGWGSGDPRGEPFELPGYSSDWRHGGPIIDREKISTSWDAGQQEWIAIHNKPYVCPPQEVGPTLLIAAMRCFVASKLGDEVEIPVELCA